MTKSQDQILRMLAIVPYLQGSQGVPVQDLARELGVSESQLHKDLMLLMLTGTGQFGGEMIDVDLTALEDHGVIHLRDADFMPRPLRITAREGAALVVALRALHATAAGDEAAIIASALAKIEAALGDAAQAPVDVVLDEVDPAIQQTVTQALRDGRRLAMTYATASRDEATERLVDPHRVFTERGRTYLEAWCLKAEDLRFFRLDRVVSAAVTDDPVESHEVEARDLAAGVFPVDSETPYALVQLDPTALWMTEYYPIDLIEQDERGIWTAKLYGADLDFLRRLVIRSAGSVAVLEPAELRSQVADTARSALAAYDGQHVPETKVGQS